MWAAIRIHEHRRLAIAFGALVLIATGCGSDDGGGVEVVEPTSTTRGYVVSSFSNLFPLHEADPCPGGFTQGPIEMRLENGMALPDNCLDPESVSDPTFKTLEGPGSVNGLDLDGLASTRGDAATCPHEDFAGPNGEPGIDYNYWRAVGCIRGFQKDEISHNVIEEAVINGSMTILVNLEGVDDETNDGAVTAQLFGSTDVPAIGADGEVLPFATLSTHEDPGFHSTVGSGDIVDGVLLVGPMDTNLRLNIQIVDGRQSLRDAYLRIEFQEDGSIIGELSGYQPIEEAYNIFGIQAGGAGAAALSYTCTGIWEALKTHADGHPDESGNCTTISNGYRFVAVPAFVAK